MPEPDPARAHPTRTLAVLLLSVLAYSLLQMMVIPAMPLIQEDLNTDPASIAWLLSGFLLSGAVATPIFGRLGDIYGKKLILIVILALFAAGSLVSALAPSLEVLIGGRVLQGLGAAVFPLCFGIARDEMPPGRVTMAIALISGSFGFGAAIGTVICGPLVDAFSWHWIFWLGLVVALTALATTWALVPESPVKTPARIDWIGALTLAAGMLLLLLGVARSRQWGWVSPQVAAMIGSGLVLLVLWARYELRVPEPMIDVRLLARRSVWPVNVATVLFGFTMYAIGFLVPQLVQLSPSEAGYGLDATVTEASLFILPASLSMLAVTPISGLMSGRFGSRLPFRIGLSVMVGGSIFLAFNHAEPWQIYLGTITAYGIGVGFTATAKSNLIVSVVPAAQTGEASGINATLRTVGGSFGTQIVAVMVTAGGTQAAAPESGFTLAFVIGAACCAGALAFTGLIPGRRPRRPAAEGGVQAARSAASRSIRA